MRDFQPEQPLVPAFFSNIRYYKIPKYQRPYTWSTDKIDDLWDDLLSNEDGHYLGVIVVKADRQDARYDVIDGQQRLTTLTILFAMLRNLYTLAEDTHTAEKLHGLIVREGYGNSGAVLNVTRHLETFFDKYIRTGDTSSHQALIESEIDVELNAESEQALKNYQRLYKLVTNHPDWTKNPLTLLNRVKQTLDNTQMLTLTVENEDDAFILFETLNYKLARLSEIDLIKNRIFMDLTLKKPEQEVEKLWDILVDNIGGEKRDLTRLDIFLKYYWWSKYDKSPPSRIFKALRSRSIEQEFNHLLDDSMLYKDLVKRTTDKYVVNYRDFTEIRNVARWLGLRQVNILLMALVRKLSDKNAKEFVVPAINELIKYLPNFVIAYKYTKRSPSAVERKYSKHAVEVFKASNKTEMDNAVRNAIADLKNEFPLREEFFENFDLSYKLRNSDNNNLIAYLLEKTMFPEGELSLNETDIEHVFPQSPDGGFAQTELKIQQTIHNLGNLSPLGKKINQEECRNLRPMQKMDIYKKSKIPMITDDILPILKVQGWSAEIIQYRTEALRTSIWDYLAKYQDQ